MKKAVLAVMATSFLVAACTTDPYTGEQKVSNTAGGAVLGGLAGASGGAGTAVDNHLCRELKVR